MKRLMRILALALAFLLLTACASAGRTAEPEGFLLYYRSVDPLAADSGGVLCTETWTFGGERPTYAEFLNGYFSRRPGEKMVSPFPKDLKCEKTTLAGGMLTVYLSGQFAELSGMERTVAEGCLVRTLTQFPSVESVRIRVSGCADKDEPLYDKSFVCEDLGADNKETAVRLYFSDVNGRYLIGEDRKNYFPSPEEIPAYIVEQLISGPEEDGRLAVIPEGTVLRDISVDGDGCCTVDFSNEFRYNRPDSELVERMAVLSIVNSLTELEDIKTVRILAEGEPIGKYRYMDLDRALERDESAIGVSRASLRETDTVLYVRSWSEEKLAAIPVRVRRSGPATLPELLLEKLIALPGCNGFRSPVPRKTRVLGAEQAGALCRVNLSREFLDCPKDPVEERMAVRSVVATLTALDDIDSVVLTIEGQAGGLKTVNLRKRMVPEQNWFFG